MFIKPSALGSPLIFLLFIFIVMKNLSNILFVSATIAEASIIGNDVVLLHILYLPLRKGN